MPITVPLSDDKYQEALEFNQQKTQSIIGAAQTTLSANEFVFFAAFDGTNNDKNHPEDPYQTNIGELWDQFAPNISPDSNYGGRYFPGVGTEGTLAFSSWFPPQVTQQVIATAQTAYDEFCVQASSWMKKHENAGKLVTVALTAFSRGNASAAIFSQMLYERGLVDPNDNNKLLIPPGQIGVSAGVLFDPVMTNVDGNLAFAPNVRNLIDIEALNEYRNLFNGADYRNHPGITTIGMYGNHCDIGGGYDNGIGVLSLQAATAFLRIAGFNIADVPANRAFVSDEFRIHSEEYDREGGQKIWDVSNAAGFSDTHFRDLVSVGTPALPGSQFTLYNGDKVTVTDTGNGTETVERLKINADGSSIRETTRYAWIGDASHPDKILDRVTVELGTGGTTASIKVVAHVDNHHVDISVPNGVTAVTFDVQAADGIDPATISTSIHSADGTPTLIAKTGAGNDTYHAEEGDTLRDADGKGVVYLNGKQLMFATRQPGETNWTDSTGNTYTLANGTLSINDPLVIEGFDNGELGIYLDDAEDPNDPNGLPKPPIYNPNAALRFFASSPLALDLDGNGVIDDIGLARSPVYFDLTNDGIAEKSGWLAAVDGLVAMDMSGNGVIDDRVELFGTDPLHTAFDRLRELADGNGDGIIDIADPLFGALRVWQDTNQEGISQAGELKTLDELGITSLDATATAISQTTANGNRLIATAGYTRNGERHLAVDIEFAYDPAQTDANPNRPLDLPPTLDPAIFHLPWLRGYGTVKSLPLAYQESPALRHAATELLASGWIGILSSFDGFIAQWTGLSQAHAERGVTRTNITVEDKVWMLERLTGQAADTYAIEAAGFGAINPGGRAAWNIAYIDSQWQEFVRREALSFAMQIAIRDWLKGVSYSLNRDRFIAVDATALHASLLAHLNAVTDKKEVAFAAITISKLKQDGVMLDTSALKQQLIVTNFLALFSSVLDDVSGTVYGLSTSGSVVLDTGLGLVAMGMNGNEWFSGNAGNDVLDGGGGNDQLYGFGGNDTLSGESGNDNLGGGIGNDILDGGAGFDNLNGGDGDDIYLFGNGHGQDVIDDPDLTPGNVDTIVMHAEVRPDDVVVTGDWGGLHINLNGGTDRLTLRNWFGNLGTRIERVTFADGSVWDAAELEAHMTVALPTENADTILGSVANDYIEGRDGSDFIYGFGGNDTLIGGVDNDELRGDIGNDSLKGDAGNDLLVGDTGNDTLDGGSGSDMLYGGQGNDIYVFGSGDGQDTVHDNDGLNTVAMAEDVVPGDTSLTRDQFNLYLSLNNGDDRLTLQYWFSNYAYRIEQVTFADGTAWSVEEIVNRVIPLPGTEADDSIFGGGAGDTIVGHGGNDYLVGEEGEDALNGGFGNDILLGGVGDDILDGGIGNDYLDGGSGSDIYLFGHGYGRDVLRETDGAFHTDAVAIAEGVAPGELLVTRDLNHLYLSLNNGADRLTVSDWFLGDYYRVDHVTFFDGKVWSAEELDDRIAVPPGTDGDEAIRGSGAGNVINGNGGNDQLYGYGGNDTLSGGGGNDMLDGGSGNDTYLFRIGDGQDTISTVWSSLAGKRDVIQFGDGITPDDVLPSRNGEDLILAIQGSQDELTVLNYFRTTTSANPYGNKLIKFADGTAWGYADVIGVSLDGTTGNDTITGYYTDDVLLGLGGSDWLLGAGGNDILDGGSGNDRLDGDVGDDTYIFRQGYGQDVIFEYDTTAGNIDTVRLADGVTPEQISVTRNVGSLFLSLNNGQDRLTFGNWFASDACQIERIAFDDGTVWGLEELLARLPGATEADDVLVGTVVDETINGLGGDDLLYGQDGSDVLFGSAGNDTLHGHDGNDTLIGGIGDDYAYGLAGDDMLVGDAGKDTLVGGTGNDVLDGGTDNDQLQGETGNDTYVFGPGSGEDSIHDYDVTAGNIDTVRLAEGIAPTDVKVSRDLWNLYVGLNNHQDRLTLSNWFGGDAYKVERVIFGDGTVWSAEELQARIPGATEESDMLFGTGGDDTFDGMGGNDTLLGQAGNDALNGDAGDDHIHGESGDDSLEGGSGDDFLFADSGNDVLGGGAGHDILQGGTGSDIYLFGNGAGWDSLYDFDPNAENVDAVRMATGIGAADVGIFRDATNLYLTLNGGADRLKLSDWFSGDAYRIEQVEFADSTRWTVSDLVAMTDHVGSDSDNLLRGHGRFFGLGGNDHISGAESNDWLDGGPGIDVLDGGAGSDILDGGAGEDAMYGGEGGDVYLFGYGSGQDRIFDYDMVAGNIDTIQFAAGVAPADVLITRDYYSLYLILAGGADTLQLQDWFGNGQVELVEFAGGTVWNAADITSRITYVANEKDNFLEGSSIQDTLDGLGGDDSLFGMEGDDILRGGAGDDYILGMDGADVLNGGAGNDWLDGGNGNDVYLFGYGSGKDWISDYDTAAGNADTIRMAAGVTPDAVTATRDPGELSLRLNGGNDLLLVGIVSFASDDLAYGIERVEFEDGTVWNTADLRALISYVADDRNGYLEGAAGDDAIDGLGGQDYLLGLEGNDTLNGGAGDDTLEGGSGDDVYLFGHGSGKDFATDWDSLSGNIDTVRMAIDVTPDQVKFAIDNNNSLILGLNQWADRLTLNNWLYDDYRFERIEFADGTVWSAEELLAAPPYLEGDDWLYGSFQDDLLSGSGGNDFLTGYDGNDTLEGGTGADSLDGGAGDDIYRFSVGEGVDTVCDAEGIDVVEFGSGVTTSDVSATRSGSRVTLSISATDSISFDVIAPGQYSVESVSFIDGSVWYATEIRQLANSTPGGQVSVGSTATQGQILGAISTLTDIDGLGTIGYQWQSSTDGTIWSDIAFAATESLALTEAEVGRLVRVVASYIDDQGTLESVVSGPTSAVANVNDLPTGTVDVSGTASVGRTLVASTTLADADGLGTIGYQWQSSSDGTTWSNIVGADSVNFTLTETQVGRQVRVRANYIDGHGTAESIVSTTTDFVTGIANQAPILARSIADELAMEDAAFSYTLPSDSFADPDSGDSLDFAITLGEGAPLPGWLTFSAATRTLAGTPTSTSAGLLELRVTATDQAGASVSDVFAIDIANHMMGTATGNSLVGTDLRDVIEGLAGNDTLDGAIGADTLVGGLGDDTYLVDSASDAIVEGLGQGIDYVRTSTTSVTLSANVENLTLLGNLALNGIGNSLDNLLKGNSGVNRLEGGDGNDSLFGNGGADVLIGGRGNDSYEVLGAAQVIELDGEGIDSVKTPTTYTLPAYVENLTLGGAATNNISGTGNNLDNVLTGNDARNTLTGNVGNDTLDGRGGIDILVGGTGNDSYLFGRGHGTDTVRENDVAVGNFDDARFLSDITADQIWLRHVGNHLEASLIGTADSLTIENWYLGSQYHVEQFRTTDGKVLLDSQVENLVQAMAAFAPPVPGQTSLPGSYQEVLAPVIAANWQ